MARESDQSVNHPNDLRFIFYSHTAFLPIIIFTIDSKELAKTLHKIYIYMYMYVYMYVYVYIYRRSARD